MCLSRQRIRGKTSPVARSCGWGVVSQTVEVGEMATVSHDFLQSLLSLEPFASWGFGVNIHHFEQEINLVGARSFGTNRTTKQRLPQKLGLSLCTVTNAHHHCLELFCLMRNYLLFFGGGCFLFCQNQTCCLSCVCCTCGS